MKKMRWWPILLTPTAVSLPMFWSARPMDVWIFVVIFFGCCCGVSIVHAQRNQTRGDRLVLRSIVTAIITILVNAVLLAAIAFAGCFYAVGQSGRLRL